MIFGGFMVHHIYIYIDRIYTINAVELLHLELYYSNFLTRYLLELYELLYLPKPDLLAGEREEERGIVL